MLCATLGVSRDITVEVSKIPKLVWKQIIVTSLFTIWFLIEGRKRLLLREYLAMS